MPAFWWNGAFPKAWLRHALAGDLDYSYLWGGSINGFSVSSIAVRPEGKVLIGGELTWYPTPPPGFTGSQFFPASAVPGTKVTLTGTNFTGATAVLVNGASASFTNAPTNNVDLRITAIVPPDANSGPITIVTPHGSATSTTSFQVLPPPLSITSSATNGLEITWPATSSAFVLESSQDLSAGSWKPVTEPLLRTNGVTRLRLTMPTGNRFYRLKTQ